MHKVWKTFLQILFPESCIGCSQTGTLLCKNCLISIPIYESSKERLLSLYIYPCFDFRTTIIKKIIWRFKYNNSRGIALLLSSALLENLNSLYAELYQVHGVKKIYLIPIPLDSNRLKSRGYNQAEELVKAIIKVDNLLLYTPLYKALYKKTTRVAQVKTKNRKQRLENIAGSMYVGVRQSVLNLDIVLVDDVVTTGATLTEARKVLLGAGARSVHAITIAH